jgi:crossover junction endodeoxyribonuclease RusA
MSLSFVVYGQPIGQGRISFVGKGRAIHSNHKQLIPWRETVAKTAAAAAARQDWNPLDAPVRLRATFYLPRPKHHHTTRGILRAAAPTWPAKRPDLDHLLRAIGDALTGIGWHDDSQIVQVRGAKRFCAPDAAMQEPGVVIEIHPALEP